MTAKSFPHSSKDDLVGFMQEYYKYSNPISKIIEEKHCKSSTLAPTEKDFECQVCWQVTNNIRSIVALNPKFNPVIEESTDPDQCIKIISDALMQNKLVTIQYEAIEGYDKGTYPGPEHHLSCIGSNGKFVFVIQFGKTLLTKVDTCHNPKTEYEILQIDDFLQRIYLVQTGQEPDWFNGIQFPHQLTIEVHDRHPLNSKLITDYLRSNLVYLYRMEFRIANKLKTPLSQYDFPLPTKHQIEFQKTIPFTTPPPPPPNPTQKPRSSRLLPPIPFKF